MNEVEAVMRAFIDARKQEALKKATSDEDIASTEARHVFGTWISAAANKAHQIQIATHVAKFSHPDSRAASLLSVGNRHAGRYIGTHSLPEPQADATGNAGALDVFGLLNQRIGGQPLWELALVEDPNFVAAVGVEATQLFARAVSRSSAIDGYQKQVYWPTPEGDVLLSPLTSSSLSQALYHRVTEDRFSDQTKQSWKARREGKAGAPITSYANLSILHVGGSKPQVVSALNSKRGGKQYALACFPPPQSDDRPVGRSCFKHFELQHQAPIYALKWYLIAQQGKAMNRDQRAHRDELASTLIRSFIDYTAALSHKAASRLNETEAAFVATGRYSDDIAQAFAGQINRWVGSPRRKATADDLSLWVKLFKQAAR